MPTDTPLETAAPGPFDRRSEPRNEERDSVDPDERGHLHQRKDFRIACRQSIPTLRPEKSARAGTLPQRTPSRNTSSVHPAEVMRVTTTRSMPNGSTNTVQLKATITLVRGAGHGQRATKANRRVPRKPRARRTRSLYGGIDRDAWRTTVSASHAAGATASRVNSVMDTRAKEQPDECSRLRQGAPPVSRPSEVAQ